MKSGHIYIMSNPAIPGLLKIGETHHVFDRKKTLSTSNVPEDYRVLHFRFCDDVRQAEQQVFHQLANYRVPSKKEFFRVNLKKARTFVDNICYDINLQNKRLIEGINEEDLSIEVEFEMVPASLQELNIDEDQ